MITASIAHQICTYRPKDYSIELQSLEEEIETKLKKKEIVYSRKDLSSYTEITGFKMISSNLKSLLKKQESFKEDSLPQGSKNFLERVWLERNYGFYDIDSQSVDTIALKKGVLQEDGAIQLLSDYLDTTLSKNAERITKGFLSGECDVFYNNTIRDVKCPKDWRSFRNKESIPTPYYWQLISYCYLYGCTQAFVDYILMPYPEDLLEIVMRGFNETQAECFLRSEKMIGKLESSDRIKSFQLKCNLDEEIEFLKSRLVKSSNYYANLTYQICMKKNGHTTK
ncbi:hypothetical protein N9933_01100 [bacterium]|nr:hypothetical protein [bacterium]